MRRNRKRQKKLTPTMRWGFTGSRHGSIDAPKQRSVVRTLIKGLGPVESFHHGDCVGWDQEFHEILRDVYGWHCNIIGHPPKDDKLRAFCRFDECRDPLPYLERDVEIVKEATYMLACPSTLEPQKHSGTWYTIRRAEDARIPLYIVFPDGSVETNFQRLV
jgi:hypothetical protein